MTCGTKFRRGLPTTWASFPGDHSKNIAESAEELARKQIRFSENAQKELTVLVTAVDKSVELAFDAFRTGNEETARLVEPLEEVIDELKETMRTNHILRMQQGLCSMETGFIWSDLLTNLERISDHCSNIAGCVLELRKHDLNTHAVMRSEKNDKEFFGARYREYKETYRF